VSQNGLLPDFTEGDGLERTNEKRGWKVLSCLVKKGQGPGTLGKVDRDGIKGEGSCKRGKFPKKRDVVSSKMAQLRKRDAASVQQVVPGYL